MKMKRGHKSQPDRPEWYEHASTSERGAYRTWLSDLRNMYGITEAQYERALLDQDGRCAICYDDEYFPLQVDHNPSTGVFRGLLCYNCNVGLGHFQESPYLLSRATLYLDAGRSPTADQILEELD